MSFERIIAEATRGNGNGVWSSVAIVAAVVSVAVSRRMKRSGSAGARKPGQAATPAGKAAAKPAAFVSPIHPLVMPPEDARPLPADATPLDSVRQLLGPAPRRFDASLTKYLTVVPPVWLKPDSDDDQWINVRNQERMRRDGAVVWGTFVQANSNLFQRNTAECGASVIYSTDPWFDRNRGALGHVAGRCYALKGTDPSDPQQATFARVLTNELTRAMGMRVPNAFTGGRPVFHSSMLMPRKHLPKGYLTGKYFPVFLDPEPTGGVVMVPAAYWPASLTREWEPEG